MLVPLAALSALTCLVAAVWASRHYLIWREHRRSFTLSATCAGPPDQAPKITVVVAGKDEAQNIEPCLRTMLAQDYPDFELIAVNDRSSDETGAIMERLAAEDDRLRVIHVEELPEGWFGKNNAMQRAIASSSSQWICMTDADCRQDSPRTLSVAMQHALRTDSDLLSLLPTCEMRTFWEQVVQPVGTGIMMIWFQPDRVNDPRRPAAYANGAFMLMKRSSYEAIGTHAAVKNRLNEDMHMAELVKGSGMKLRVVRTEGLARVRMYTSLRQSVRGWGRIFLGTFGTLGRLTVSLAVLMIMGLLPYAAAATGLGVAFSTQAPSAWWWVLGAAGAAAVLLQWSVIWRFYALIGGRSAMFWSYPLGCIVGIVALLVAISKLRPGARITWRNTTYEQPGN